MYSVVMNDLIQFALKMVAAIGIAVIAIVLIRPDQIMAMVPAGWDQLFFGTKLHLDWSHLMPQLNERIYGAKGDGYSMFMFFAGMLFFKGVLVSMAGPTPNYAIQHVLSTRSPREAALENMVMTMVSLTPRFLLIAAIAVLGIVFFSGGPALDGRRRRFREDSARRVAIPCAGGAQGHFDRGAVGVVHEHVRFDGQFRRGLRRERHLQTLHQSQCAAEAASVARLDCLHGDYCCWAWRLDLAKRA